MNKLTVGQKNALLINLAVLTLIKHWTKTYIPTTLGIHWVCIGNVLNPAN